MAQLGTNWPNRVDRMLSYLNYMCYLKLYFGGVEFGHNSPNQTHRVRASLVRTFSLICDVNNAAYRELTRQ